MNLLPYPGYKPSGVEWLGDIPKHWQIKRLRDTSSIRKGRLPTEIFPFPIAETDQPYLSMEFLRGETESPHYVAPCKGLVCAEAGDILLLWDGSNAGEFLQAKRGVVSSTVARFEVRNICKEFLFFVSKAIEPQIKDQTVGMGIPHVNGDELRSCFLPFPSPLEQRVIAEFLDHETTKLDALVGKKRALIDKLKEKRMALISRTVTRGLPPDAARVAGFDPNPKSKSSGVEWLGDVPAHWVVAQLHRKLTVLDCKHKTVSFVDDGVPVASIREVHGFDVDLTNAKQTTEDEYLDLIEGDRRPRQGDIIYSRNVTVGEAALVSKNEKFCIGQDVCLIRSGVNNSIFMLFFLRSLSASQQVEASMVGATFRRINVGQIKAFWICFPPVNEQGAIADYLNLETAKIERLIEKIEAAIERLSEYRSALIMAAVTGKIDVSNRRQTL